MLTEEAQDRLYWFLVSHQGDQAEFRAKDYDELLEFTAEYFNILNIQFHFVFTYEDKVLTIKNKRNFNDLVAKYVVKGQNLLLDV